MLNVRSMSSSGTRPCSSSHWKRAGTCQRDRSTLATTEAGSTRGRLSVMPPPVMCAMPLIRPPPSSGRTSGRYDRCGSSSASPTVRPSAGHVAVHGQPEMLEHDAARQRVAVGVQAARGHADEDVARADAAPGDQLLAIGGADDEAREIVFALGVEPRHLGGLAAEQRAAVLAAGRGHAADDRLGHLRRQPSGGEVVEKEERLGALHEDVVDAVVDEVHAHRVVPVGQERDLELRARRRPRSPRAPDRGTAPARAGTGRRTSRCRRGPRA